MIEEVVALQDTAMDRPPEISNCPHCDHPIWLDSLDPKPPPVREGRSPFFCPHCELLVVAGVELDARGKPIIVLTKPT